MSQLKVVLPAVGPPHDPAALLESIIEKSLDAIIMEDLEGKILVWSNSARNIFGYSAEEIIGSPVSILIPAERSGESQTFAQRLGRDGLVLDCETVRLKKGGFGVDVSLTILPLKDARGQTVGACTILRDLSERRQAEKALQSSEKLATLGRLTATVAHEINNPLDAVTNLLYLLNNYPLADEAQRLLTLAQNEVSRVARIAKSTLVMYRDASQPVAVNVSELLESILDLYGGRVMSKNIKVQKRFDYRGTVRGFPGELRQIFGNLIINAVEAVGQEGTLRLHILASRTWDRGERRGIRVVIADDGLGIHPSNREKIFQPFFTTKGEQGTGLGLWITAELIRNHGGSIRVRSSVRQGRNGTCFSVFLPRRGAGERAEQKRLRFN
jgi:two-component system, chemotaxis family, CheB/CheR fusion protein